MGSEFKTLLVLFLFSYLMGCSSLSQRPYLKDAVVNSNIYRSMPLQLETTDKKRIVATHYSADRSKVIILAHGFFNNKDAYLFKKIAKDLFESYDVIAFDFRGHGKSSGLFSWTTHETKDLEAVIQYAKTKKYERIGVLGFSLGAAVGLIAASEHGGIDAVIAVSAPFDFAAIDYHFWEPEMLEDLKLNIGYKGKGKGVRPGNPFLSKVKPLDIIEKVSPTPVFFIHGSKDWLIKPVHSEKLFDKAGEPKRILIVPNAGHAEMIYDSNPEQFIKACKEWFDQTLN